MEEGWIEYLQAAKYLILGGYPVPTQDPEELAKIMYKKQKIINNRILPSGGSDYDTPTNDKDSQ